MNKRTHLVLLIVLVTGLVAWGANFVEDSDSHPPPSASQARPYSPPGAWLPGQAGFPEKGETYVDPTLGGEVVRLTADFSTPNQSDIYARNGFWNADGTRAIHRNQNDHFIIDTTTGEVVRANVPGVMAWSSFDPVDPNLYYYPLENSFYQYDLTTGESSVLKDFGGYLGDLGGSVDYIDASGRFWLVNIAGQVRIWDKQMDTLYDGAIPENWGSGWVGISPDANYVIVADSPDFRSYVIDHQSQRLETVGTLFWTLCGDHGDIISPSDGKTYLVVSECWGIAAVFRVDVSIPQSGANVPKQQSDNVMLLDVGWEDGQHFSCVSRGALRDWCFVSMEANDDSFDDPGPWRPYKQEILMVQTLPPFTVRRLAHHRSRSLNDSYYYQPRVNADWAGSRVAWASNFGHPGTDYSDIYAIDLASSSALAAPSNLRIVP